MKKTLTIGGGVALLLAIGFFTQAPSIAAGGLLYPARRAPQLPPPAGCEARDFSGDGVTLRGWWCAAQGERRGTVIYLHGIADNRDSSVGAINRYVPKGLDVIAYDGRRHGASDGEFCTYGYFEKQDLRKILATLKPGPVVLLGTSLGAAVALQTAAIDPLVSGVVSAEVFSDLETIARDRAPGLLPESVIVKSFREAERRAAFRVDDVSPVLAAASIRVPVVIIHGAGDVETKPSHSERVFAALAGPKQLIMVAGAGHNQSLHGPAVWKQIDEWVELLLMGGR